MERDSFVFYASFAEAGTDLSEDDRLKFYDRIINYALNEDDSPTTGVAEIMFKLVRPQIDANSRKYRNGRKGGRPTKPTTSQNKEHEKPVVIESENQWFPNEETSGYGNEKPNVNVNDNVNVHDNDNVNENVNDTNCTLTSTVAPSAEEKKSGVSQKKQDLVEKLTTAGDVIDGSADADDTASHPPTPLSPHEDDPPPKNSRKERNKQIDELIDALKAAVESHGYVYQAGKRERQRAWNILTAKAFTELAQKTGYSNHDFALRVVDASVMLDFRSGQINNCVTLYKHYGKIYNEFRRQHYADQVKETEDADLYTPIEVLGTL